MRSWQLAAGSRDGSDLLRPMASRGGEGEREKGRKGRKKRKREKIEKKEEKRRGGGRKGERKLEKLYVITR